MVEEGNCISNDNNKPTDIKTDFNLCDVNMQSYNTPKDLESGKVSDNKSSADFEEAISACGFGKFNVLLLLSVMPAFMTAVYITSVMSFIMSSAECDLKLSMTDMGTLNSIPYAGMLTSAMLWGYLSDTLGRRIVLIWGFVALTLCEFIASFSQTYWMLVFFKFLAGFIFNGPFAALISYISELHSASIRSRVLIFIGLYYAIANIILPLTAWSVIPNEWNIPLFGVYELHSWHIFLILFTIPPLAGAVALYTLPESPKFLMSRGRNEEALEVFKRIYSINSRKDPETYPIKSLEEPIKGEAPRGWEAIKGGFKQIKPLCMPPAIYRLFLACFINGGNMLGSNTLRLWFPQIADIISDYNAKYEETASLCHIISTHVSNKTEVPIKTDIAMECVTLDAVDSTYINSIIIGSGTLIMYFIGLFLIDWIGKRKMLSISLLFSGVCALSLYWTVSYNQIVIIFTIFVAVSGFAATLLATVAVQLFSTSTRVMAVAIFLMIGRLGTVIGGLTFPILLSSGCFTPFLFIAAIVCSGGIFCLLLPSTSNKSLE